MMAVDTQLADAGCSVSKRPLVSAVWFCGEAPARLEATFRHYVAALAMLQQPTELIVVEADSPTRIGAEHWDNLPADVALTVISMHRNCTQSLALEAGLRVANGEIIVQLPMFLQSDASALPQIVAKIDDPCDVVVTWRHPRVDSRWCVLQTSAFNWVTRRLTGVPLHDLNSGLRAVRREVLQNLPLHADLHRYLPVLASREGFRVAEIEVRHVKEQNPQAASIFTVFMRRILDLFTLFFLLNFTRKPLRFFGFVGSGAFAVGLAITVVIAIQRLRGYGGPLAERPALVFGALFIVLGFQLISIGLLGELITFTLGRGLRAYQIQKIHRFRND
jgi:hypothetical protein